MNIGTNIRNRRKELGMTQEELAERMGYKSKSSINKIELGENDIPQSKVVKFAEVLRTSVGYLMGWEQEKIDTESEMISEANAAEDAEEERLKNLQEEFGEVHFTPDEVKKIKLTYYDLVNIPRNQQEIIEEMWSLQLSVEELKELCDYAKYLTSKRK